jgi:hypothetical protein
MLALGLVYLLRLVGGLLAPDLPLSVPKWYPPLTGAVWGTAWCAIALAAFIGRRWARRGVLVIGVAFLAWYWLDRLAFARSAYALRSIPFSLLFSALSAGAVIAILRLHAVRAYLGGSGHE